MQDLSATTGLHHCHYLQLPHPPFYPGVPLLELVNPPLPLNVHLLEIFNSGEDVCKQSTQKTNVATDLIDLLVMAVQPIVGHLKIHINPLNGLMDVPFQVIQVYLQVIYLESTVSVSINIDNRRQCSPPSLAS